MNFYDYKMPKINAMIITGNTIFLNVYTKNAMSLIEDALDYMCYFKDAYEDVPAFDNDDVVRDIVAEMFKTYRFWPYVDNAKELDFIRPSIFKAIECTLNGEAMLRFAEGGEEEFSDYFKNDNLSNIKRIEMLIRKYKKHLMLKLNSVSKERNVFVKDVIFSINMCNSILNHWNNSATNEDLRRIGHRLTPFEEMTIIESISNNYDNVLKTISSIDQNQKWFEEMMRYTTD